MSRVGNSPILIPEGVTVDLKPNHIVIKGKLGELDLIFHDIEVTLKEKNIVLSRTSESKSHKSKHGLYRALIANMVKGVSDGFTKELELVGEH